MSLSILPILPKEPGREADILPWTSLFTKAVANIYRVLADTLSRPLMLNSTNVMLMAGSGIPEGIVSASPGSIFRNSSGVAGQYLQYDKKTGSGNTGWVGSGTTY
jgi:hypothetical protein